MLIQSDQWKFGNYFQTLLDVILDRQTITSAAGNLGLSTYHLNKILQQHFPYYHLNRTINQIKILKNNDLVYIDNNLNASLLGNKQCKITTGKTTDYKLYPKEFADSYVAMDVNTLETNNATSKKELVLHKHFGEVAALGHSTPVLNEHGDIIGVLIFSHIDIKLSGLAFPLALSYLNQGLANYFISNKSYKIQLNSATVRLSGRQVEFLLYYVAGFSSKKISNFMKLSSRSVDSHAMRIKEHLNTTSRSQLSDLLLKNDFFNQL